MPVQDCVNNTQTKVDESDMGDDHKSKLLEPPSTKNSIRTDKMHPNGKVRCKRKGL